MNVLIIQALAKAYRVPFFDRLHARLGREGVRLTVAYGEPPPGEREKGDDVELDPAYAVRVPARWMAGDRLVYHPVLSLARRADLVIVEQANKHLVNLPLLASARLGGPKLAFWGQGRDPMADGRSLAERIKAWMVPLPDWWFAYTAGVAAYVASRGVAADSVTVVQNAIDTRTFAGELAAVSEDDLAAARARFRIAPAAPVALFCGSLYAGKRVDFLVAAARRIRAELPDFHLVVIGDGQERAHLAASAPDWVHFLGRRTGHDKALWFRMSRAFLIPAYVGLAVVDAFAAGLPVITTDLPRAHSVELEYVEPGRNGMITAPDADAYAAAVVDLFRHPVRHAQLAAGARAAGERYSIETMIENFAQGVLRCLHSARGGPP